MTEEYENEKAAPVYTGGDAPLNLYERRKLVAAPEEGGFRALVTNRHVLSIAVFASMGGLIYGYMQGGFGQILNMSSFARTVHPNSISNPTSRGLLTSILELGAWVGALINGYLADKLGRKMSVVVACCVFILGAIVQACAKGPNYILGGRFVNGLGVGSLSMIVPLYNAELAPAEVRGALVSLQQLSITCGIMISYWIGYGTNFIGGTGDGQSDAAWLIPVCLPILLALILLTGFLFFMPQSPRWLVNRGRDDEAIAVLSRVRQLPPTDERLTLEFLEIKAQHMFEVETDRERFPQYMDGTFKSNFMLGFKSYMTLFTDKSLRPRSMIAILIMVFQQWCGINAILYFAPFIFQDLGLKGNSLSLLATGVGGVLMFIATIPAVLWVDKLGRRPVLVCGAIGMALSHFTVAGISGGLKMFDAGFTGHTAASWMCAVFVWIFVINFGYSWGPCAWVVISELFPLSVRSKGVSIGASSNWLMNFVVGMATSDMIVSMKYGTFIFFGAFSVFGAIYVQFFVPETKGRTLEEIDELFDSMGNLSASDRQRLERIYAQLGLLGDDLPILEKAGHEHVEETEDN